MSEYTYSKNKSYKFKKIKKKRKKIRRQLIQLLEIDFPSIGLQVIHHRSKGILRIGKGLNGEMSRQATEIIAVPKLIFLMEKALSGK